jgi:hypothetical protein
MRSIVIAVVLAACTPSPGPTTDTTTPTPPADTRTPIEKRRDEGCEQVGRKSAACAVEESNRKFADGKITKTEHEQAVEPKVVRALGDKYIAECRHEQLSSRQVRVMEVCMREETECAAWQSCIANMQPQGTPSQPAPAPPKVLQ